MLHLGISFTDIYHMLASFINNVFHGNPEIHLSTCLTLGKMAKDMEQLRGRPSRNPPHSCIDDIYFLSTLLHFCRVSFAMYGCVGTKYNLGYCKNYIPAYNTRTRLRLIGWRLLQSAVCTAPTMERLTSKCSKTIYPPVDYWTKSELKEESLEDFLPTTLNCTRKLTMEVNIDDHQRILDMERKQLKTMYNKKRTEQAQNDSEQIIHAVEDPNIQDHEFIGSKGRTCGICYDWYDSNNARKKNHCQSDTQSDYVHSCPQDWPLSTERLYKAFNMDYANVVKHHRASEYLMECDNDLYAFITEMGVTADQILLFYVTNHAFEAHHCLYVDPYRREVIVAVRGTMSLGDIKVDLTVGYTRVTRPPPAYDDLICSCLCPSVTSQFANPTNKTTSVSTCNRKIPKRLRNKLFKDHTVDYTDKSMENGMYAHQGIYLASSSLFYTIKPYIEQLFSIVKDQHSFTTYFRNENALNDTADWPYTFVFTGHSLGAGVAALLGYFFRPLLGDRLRVYGFGAPPTVSLSLFKELEIYSYQIALECDVVCRLSLSAIQTTLWRASLRDEIQARGLTSRLLVMLECVNDSISPECSEDIDAPSRSILHELSDEALLQLYLSKLSRPPFEKTLTLHTPGSLLILELLRAQASPACPQSLADINNLCACKGVFDLRGQRFAQLYEGSSASIEELIITKDMWAQHLMYFEYLLLVYYGLFPNS
ncbi:Hypothetical protein GLP15_3885 [Giardia lamblia P15]|uniref:sn-1-specific diacylglycerol lipase n=1 Tax=Giardia intestinalis (strain P15) TaxID=658858 RepID=E1F0M0_GIAIA|nr:Hypothetical protein GLP15_3885 [Giardia lamblia P15]